ncbi:MAG: transcription antitermination factor NusB [Pseudomonadota bacterium]
MTQDITQTADLSEKSADPRSAARLAAVQALFQLSKSPTPVDRVIDEFCTHRLGEAIDDRSIVNADQALFRSVVEGAAKESRTLDQRIAKALAKGWRIDRIDPTLLAILRAGAYEISGTETPRAVIIDEYLDIAAAFFDDGERKFVNAVLDKLADENNPS